MELVAYITQPNSVAVFLLLMARFSGVFAFFPFFDNQLISINVRAAMVFFMSVAFYPLASYTLPDMSMVEFLFAALLDSARLPCFYLFADCFCNVKFWWGAYKLYYGAYNGKCL